MTSSSVQSAVYIYIKLAQISAFNTLYVGAHLKKSFNMRYI